MLLVRFYETSLNSLGKYDFNSQICKEVQEALSVNFYDINTAFEFFLSQESESNFKDKKLTFSGFEKGIQSLLPSRFGKEELEYLWKGCCKNYSTLNFSRFQNIFDNNKFTGVQHISSNK